MYHSNNQTFKQTMKQSKRASGGGSSRGVAGRGPSPTPHSAPDPNNQTIKYSHNRHNRNNQTIKKSNNQQANNHTQNNQTSKSLKQSTNQSNQPIRVGCRGGVPVPGPCPGPGPDPKQILVFFCVVTMFPRLFVFERGVWGGGQGPRAQPFGCCPFRPGFVMGVSTCEFRHLRF